MSYISTQLQGNHVLVWERGEDGDRNTVLYEAPYYFYVDDPNGKYTTMFNTKVSKVSFNTSEEAYNARKQFTKQRLKIWESDMGPELRILSANYYNIPAPKLTVTHLDIEVDYDPLIGFSSPKNPYAPINSCSLYHEHKKQMAVLVVPPNDSAIKWTSALLEQECNNVLEIPTNEYSTRFIICENERELLLQLMDEIQDSDILVGWNSLRFDFPYIAGRMVKILGKSSLRMLSFPEGNIPILEERIIGKKSEDDESNSNFVQQTEMVLEVSGRILLDYMLLYKKYEASEKPSYKLSAISDDVLINDDGSPSLPKLEYDGSLADLYHKNLPFFVRYNIRDTEILHGFETKLGYVDVANQNVHLSCGQFKHVLGTLKLAELAIVNHCHHIEHKVVKNITEPEIDRSIEGALVLYPQIGMQEWIGSIDINSLYPTAIRSLNMSPEMIRGQFVEEMDACLEISKQSDEELTMTIEKTRQKVTLTAKEWYEFLLQKKWAVSGYGTVFDQNHQGIIPAVLTDWFAQRKQYQAKKKEAERKMSELVKKYKNG